LEVGRYGLGARAQGSLRRKKEGRIPSSSSSSNQGTVALSRKFRLSKKCLDFCVGGMLLLHALRRLPMMVY